MPLPLCLVQTWWRRKLEQHLLGAGRRGNGREEVRWISVDASFLFRSTDQVGETRLRQFGRRGRNAAKFHSTIIVVGSQVSINLSSLIHYRTIHPSISHHLHPLLSKDPVGVPAPEY